jgi:DNA-binding PadR family transcriptional regulator
MDHTLLLLGLIKLEAMHGYQLSDLLERRLKYLTDLKKPTLYHLLAKLAAAGLIIPRVSRAGNRPERHTYRLTPAGEREFRQRLQHNLQDAPATYFDDDIGLLFLSEIPAAEARAYLTQKRASVEKRLAEIERGVAAHKPGTPAYYTLRHHQLHLQTERAWLDELLTQLGKRLVRQNILDCLSTLDERETLK